MFEAGLAFVLALTVIAIGVEKMLDSRHQHKIAINRQRTIQIAFCSVCRQAVEVKS
tara:strand:+ start:461 stop:628 length:168 start_codon:yes stop_codon:yes gene_type:complete